MPDNISCFGFDDGVYQKVREGHRFDLPATEEEETYLEETLKIWKKNSKNVVYIFSV